MNPLNDDELDALLRQARSDEPVCPPAVTPRLVRSYQDLMPPRSPWNWLLFRPVRIPAAFGVLGALLLLAAGAVVGRTLLAPTVIAQTRRVEVPVIQERVVYRECNTPQRNSEPPSGGFTFTELPPVREIQPRVVRRLGDDR